MFIAKVSNFELKLSLEFRELTLSFKTTSEKKMKNPKSTQEHKAKQMSFLDSTKKYRKDESKHSPSTTKKIQTSSVVPSREKASKIQQI